MVPRRDPRIALLSDQQLFLDGIEALLRQHAVAVMTTYRSLAALIAREHKPDVLVVDLEHERDDVMDVVAALRKAFPAAQVVLIGTPQRQGAANGPNEAAVETPEAGVGRLVAALAGRRHAPSTETQRRRRQWARVTPRQREVLRWLALGCDNREIGRKLRIGERAVKAHVSALLEELDARNRTQLALIAREAGVRPRAPSL